MAEQARKGGFWQGMREANGWGWVAFALLIFGVGFGAIYFGQADEKVAEAPATTTSTPATGSSTSATPSTQTSAAPSPTTAQ